MFNNLDRSQSGFLPAAEAQPVLVNSGLSRETLRQIWCCLVVGAIPVSMCSVTIYRNLADVDKDGRLTSEEFSIAMYLVERAKQGTILPTTLPLELLPSSHVTREAPGSPSVTSSFEDRRKANFEQGRQELERRRKLLEEQREREKVRMLVAGSWNVMWFSQEEKERKRQEEEERRKQQQ